MGVVAITTALGLSNSKRMSLIVKCGHVIVFIRMKRTRSEGLLQLFSSLRDLTCINANKKKKNFIFVRTGQTSGSLKRAE